MKINSRIMNITARAMEESLGTQTMEQFTQHIIHNYNLHARTGYPENIPVPRRDAAKQITRDIKQQGLFLEFITQLIVFHNKGYMGRKYPIPRLRDIIKEIYDQGYIYDDGNSCFVENSTVRKTRNWGTLRDDEEYIFTFLRIDIVNNSQLVRTYPQSTIEATYKDLYEIVHKAQDKRNGRIWDWEGDGGLVAFYFSDKNQHATLAGIEIIHELLLYNLMFCRLDTPLEVRVAIHSGYCYYSNDMEIIKRNETIKHVIEIESRYTKPNTLTISETAARSLDERLKQQLIPHKSKKYFSYVLDMEG